MIDFQPCSLYLSPVRTPVLTTLPYPLQLFLVFVLMAGITRTGMSFAVIDAGITQIWFPSGVSIVVLFLLGKRFAPAVLLGTLVNYLFAVPSVTAAVLLASAAAAEGMLGSALLRWTSFDASLRSLRDIGKLIVVSGAVSTAAGALASTLISLLFITPLQSNLSIHLPLWWLGNLVSVVLLAPAVCLAAVIRGKRWSRRHSAEFSAHTALIIVAAVIVFHSGYMHSGLDHSLAFILFPFAIIASVRFGMPGAVMAVLIIAVNAYLSAVTGGGLFAAEDHASSILLADIFVLVIGATALSLAALVEERRLADRTLRTSGERYRIITERTGQLVYDYQIDTGAIHWGGAVTEVTQYTPEEFQQFGFKTWLEHVHPDDRAGAEQAMLTAMQHHRESRKEYRFRRKDGSYVEVLDRGAFLYRKSTDIVAYRMMGTMADISVYNRTMQQLRESEERYKLFSLLTSDYIYSAVVTADGLRTEWVSEAFELITGYTIGDVNGLGSWEKLVHPEDREWATIEAQKAFRNETVVVEYRILTKQGEVKWIRDCIKPFTDAGTGAVVKMMGGVQDITERKQVEERFRILIERSADGIILLDKRGVITFSSASAESILGYRPEELMGRSIFSILHPSEAKRYTYRFGRLTVEFDRSQALLGRFLHKNGQWIHIEGMVTNLFNNPSVNAFVANFRDVTGRISAEERLLRSLQEKEILLKEVHHRVKNNMQVISSLLNLQSSSMKDAAAVSVFRESQNRVKSMSLVHEILYQSQDLASVNFSAYVKQLVNSLQRSFGAKSAGVTIAVKVGAVALDMDEAIPCGLIINELVSNALKYAFPRKRSGTVTITMKQLRSSRVRLTVSDDGAGMAKQTGPSVSLGLKLVRALTEQLHGTISIETASGTSVHIEFPHHRPTAV